LVRVNKSNGAFDKDYQPNYTTKVFQIAAMKHKIFITHKLWDKTGPLIIGDFYESYSSKNFHYINGSYKVE